MNSHLVSGAVGALLALAGSTAIDTLNCTKLDAQHIAVAEGPTSVSILPSGITIKDNQNGATCTLSSKGIVLFRQDESVETGSASLLYSPEIGAQLNLFHKEATASLLASNGSKPEASVRTSFAKNAGAVIAAPERAHVGIVDGKKGSFMTARECLWSQDYIAETLGGVPLQSTGDEQGPTVFITRTGDRYHLAGCQYLRTSMIPMELSQAIKRFAPCSLCVKE